MIIKPLYRYARPDGGTTVSPLKPADREYTELYRIVADEGKVVTKDGQNHFSVIDTDNAEGWTEVDRSVVPDDNK